MASRNRNRQPPWLRWKQTNAGWRKVEVGTYHVTKDDYVLRMGDRMIGSISKSLYQIVPSDNREGFVLRVLIRRGDGSGVDQEPRVAKHCYLDQECLPRITLEELNHQAMENK